MKISKKLAYYLRHNPEGMKMSDSGWVRVSDILKKMNISRKLLETVVENDDKQRYSFSFCNRFIRANQGHSLKVNIKFKEVIPPDFLYHGTSSKFLESIFEKGLLPMNRNYVHLSKDRATAITVGKRRTENPVILKINCKKMVKLKYNFYLSENNVYLTKEIPSKFITVEYD